MQRGERLNAILEQVGSSGRVDVADLAGRLGVSGATVRRDLQTLSRNQLLVRTHGGAVSQQTDAEVPARVKAVLRQPEKRRIARAADRLVGEGAVLGITGGSTTLELARVLVGRRGLTVVTNSLDVASELAGNAGIRLVMIGGIVRRSRELVGPAAETMLANYHLDLAFIGVDGLSAEGCTTYDEMEATTDAAFLQQARRRIVVADSSKIGKVTFARISPLAGITDLVTDRGAPADALEPIRQAGVAVIAV
ncbi:DeoR/GlpR family DNA-binding transcription regulator [Microlunatus flavus]|uniref:DeoR family transcriptional regulator, aga operon transcriptional repressor n=1 Tax=Microlunatus flavus TaxID=1036181 RepID=A0A1H9MHI2_9ACTN|nr:DeoR/GlpR family DNA-binding transcription regulator [Microlunatus flavus]SER22991.1 DeoR family transcriptional regulator, aga operon transcriptional repressor [Microlunatus flavus]